jgi:guanylate kinase
LNKDMLIIILNGPSASGKSTILECLMADPQCSSLLQKPVTATTRKPRPGEVNGIDYWFLTPEEFGGERKRGNIIEEAEYAGANYGSLKSELQRISELGKHAITILEINGVEAMKKVYGQERVVGIYIYRDLKEIFEELKKRPIGKKEMEERFEKAIEEHSHMARFNNIVYNTGNIEDSVKQTIEIINREIQRLTGRLAV